MYIINDSNGNVWDTIECESLEETINEANDRWEHLTERERSERECFYIEHDGDVVFDYCKLHTYAMVDCLMGMDFIELKATDHNAAIEEAREWFKEKCQNPIWESACIITCPAKIDEDGEIEPDGANYVKWTELDMDEFIEDMWWY